MILIYFKDYYADEFPIFGFCIMKREKWERIKKESSYDDIKLYYFGTNQYIEYDSKGCFLSRFWSRSIKDDEVRVLKRMFSGISSGFGHWPLKTFKLGEKT